MARLVQHAWPGNVRELENVIRRLVVLEGEQAIDGLMSGHGGAVAASRVFDHDKPAGRGAPRGAGSRVPGSARGLDGVGWNRAEAARILKVSYKTLLNKIGECRLQRMSRV